MDLWEIFVIGCLRINLNIDYDRLQELCNQHQLIRQMLGKGLFDKPYGLQTIKDNVKLLTPDILCKINETVVKAGHQLLNASKKPLQGRADSFVVETDVEYPTDTRLLLDALRTVIHLLVIACENVGQSDWRQYKYNCKKLKRLLTLIQKLRQSTSKDEKKKEVQQSKIIATHKKLLTLSEQYLEKAAVTIKMLRDDHNTPLDNLLKIEGFMSDCYRQMDQISRRVIDGDKIPHNEKSFSIFQPHTEWISKGKAGVLFELGLRVCIVEDQHQFILSHRVMEQETDDKIAVAIIKETKKQFPQFIACSFDKGFHSPSNQKELKELLDLVVLPKKGRLSKSDKEQENTAEFISSRHQHSAVESAINALEHHGLDRCPDHGIDGFKRYVALSIVGRNIQKLGEIIRNKSREKEKKTYRNNCKIAA
jgi:hypothetical protein